MANIIIPGKWTSQPQYAVAIEKSNPITRGLVFAWAGGPWASNLNSTYSPTANLDKLYQKGASFGMGALCSSSALAFPSVMGKQIEGASQATVFGISSRITDSSQILFRRASSGDRGIQVMADTFGGVRAFIGPESDFAGYKATWSKTYTNHRTYKIGVAWDGTSNFRCQVDGVDLGSPTLTGSAPSTLGSTTEDCKIGQSYAGNDGGHVYLSLAWNRALSDVELASLNSDPWQVFRKTPKILYFSAASGAVTHPSTGALTAQDAVVAGTAAHIALHPSTGALSAGSSVVAGTAARIANHQSTGALSAGYAVVDGTAVNTPVGTVSHPSTGALTADSAIVAGTAAHIVNHQTTGALLADSAVVDGASVHIGTGAPTNLTGTPTNSTINWTWDSVATATGYEIEFGLDGGGYTVVDVGNTLTYEQTGLNENTLYEARVRAYYDVTGYLLLESNDRLLLESGDGLLQEAA